MSIDDEVRTEPYSGDVEEEDTSGDPITHPFDPSQIRVRTWLPTISLLMTRIDEGELQLDPDFQRRQGIWTSRAQSRLVESLLIRIPLPSFYLEGDVNESMVVVDGVQRLTALHRFFGGELVLMDLEFLTELDGRRFGDLSRNLQRRIEETQVTAYVIEAGTPDEAKFNIFSRINTGGVPLSPQEIRNALKHGPIVALLEELGTSEAFRRVSGNRIDPMRLAHHECVLRFLAFSTVPYAQYEGPDLQRFLNDRMAALNAASSPELEDWKRRFYRAVGAAERLFGEDAFRRPRGADGRRNPFNRALFEAWAVTLDQQSDADLAALCDCKDTVRAKFVKLAERADFRGAISGGTGKVSSVRGRFRRISDLVKEVLGCPAQPASSTSSASVTSESTSAD